MKVLTVIILIANILISVDAVRLLGVRRVSFALLMAPGILICFYTLCFNLLSIFDLITFYSLFTIEIILLSVYFLFRKNAIKPLILEFAELIQTNKKYLLAILSPSILILMSVVFFPPNNQDSMTYHLARVIHWIQNQNISYYFTSVDRQNRMGPGAETLLLLLQILSSSDRLANTVQYFAFLFFCISLPDTLRAIGIRRRNVLFLSVFTISTPMLLLQASTTQNDLLSATLTWSIVLVLLHAYSSKKENIPKNIFALIGLLASAAYLVKPTSLLILLPLISFMGLAYLHRFRHVAGTISMRFCLAFVVFAVLSGPDIYRKLFSMNQRAVSFGDVLYPIAKEWDSSRFFNVFLAAMHHSPLTYAQNEQIIQNASATLEAKYNREYVRTNWTFYSHEDYVGNPMHFIVFLFLTMASLIVIAFVPFKRRYLLSILPFCAFLMLALFIRDSPWTSRIQLPFFLIIPMCFIPLEAIRWKSLQLCYRYVLSVLSFTCLAVGLLIVSQNATKPLTFAAIFNPSNSFGDVTNLYYPVNKELKAEHDKIIDMCRANNLKTVGVIAGGEFYEYPLSWQLYKIGVKLIHIPPTDPMAVDLIYTEQAISSQIGDPYAQAGEKLFLRRKPIIALAELNDLQLSLSSLLIPEHGAFTDKGIILFGNGKITTPYIYFPAGHYVLQVKSHGREMDGHGTHLNVSIENEKFGDINSITPAQIDSLEFRISRSGEYRLQLEFDNDIYDAARGFDRNAHIEQLQIFRHSK